MKYFIVTVYTLFLLQSFIAKDKIMHFSVGYITSHASSSIIVEYTDNKKLIKYGPILACLVVGVGKELVDKYDSDPKSTFEVLDIAYTVGGGITLLSIDIGKK
mgnify:CR=1 FL=1